MSLIIENLKEAIVGESKAMCKYELFAMKAREENHLQVAKLFEAISSAEEIHIRNHLRALSKNLERDVKHEEIVKVDENELQGIVKDTASNLHNAIEGELYETKKMYKEFEKNSLQAGDAVAELSFSLARKAEKVHARLYKSYLKKLEKGKEILDREIYICQICGNVELEHAPEKCPVCDHGKKFFKKMA